MFSVKKVSFPVKIAVDCEKRRKRIIIMIKKIKKIKNKNARGTGNKRSQN